MQVGDRRGGPERRGAANTGVTMAGRSVKPSGEKSGVIKITHRYRDPGVTRCNTESSGVRWRSWRLSTTLKSGKQLLCRC